LAPLNLLTYTRKEALRVLSSEYGWLDYGGKHKESKFTDYFQEVYLPERFGIEKKRAHLSSLIMNSELTREEALDQIHSTKLQSLEKQQVRDFVSSKLGVTVDKLKSFEEMPFVKSDTYANERYLTAVITALSNVRNSFRRIMY
jgi:hypothetical protein